VWSLPQPVAFFWVFLSYPNLLSPAAAFFDCDAVVDPPALQVSPYWFHDMLEFALSTLPRNFVMNYVLRLHQVPVDCTAPRVLSYSLTWTLQSVKKRAIDKRERARKDR
jgi:hypothetical protein